MSENTIKFIQDYDGNKLEKTMHNSITWIELSEEYLRFLKGCGYHLEASDLSEFFSELAGD